MKNSLFSIAAMIGLMLLAALTVVKASDHPSFRVEVHGHGAPVILIPGLACSGDVWNETVKRYEGHYECHVLTLAGFAGVPSIEKDLLASVTTDLAAYIRENKLNHPVVVGHSLGGFIALRVASADPDLVGNLVIVDALPFLPATQNPGATPESVRPQAEMMRAMIAGQTPDEYRRTQPVVLKSMISDSANIQRALQWGTASDSKSVGQAVYELMTTDLRESLAKIRAQTLILGTWIAYQPFGATMASTQGIFESQYARLPHHSIRMATKARHFVMLDDPKWFFTQLDEVIATGRF